MRVWYLLWIIDLPTTHNPPIKHLTHKTAPTPHIHRYKSFVSKPRKGILALILVVALSVPVLVQLKGLQTSGVCLFFWMCM